MNGAGPRRDGPRRPRRDRGAGPRLSGPPRGRVGPPRPPEPDPARLAALELLTAVRTRDAYANLALPGILRRHRLRDRDAALATELGYGTLRAQGLLDAVIEECTDRPLSRVEHTLLDALRLGAYQLLRTRIPSHAAVATTVELVRGEAGSRAGGFVNAVLRRVGERDEPAWVAALAPPADEDPVGNAAFAHSHPRWIAQAFADALGRGVDPATELNVALAADDARPVVHLLARPGEITAGELALVTGGEEAPYSPYGVHLVPGSGDVSEIDAVGEGLAIVQDEGSQLVALALTRAPLTGPDGGRWLDLCSGPGGKAALLGGLVALDGGTVDAVEPSESRAGLVRRATDGLPVTVHVADGREAPLPDAAFDRVLVDAPVHRPRGAAPPPGVAVAAPTLGRCDAHRVAAGAAHRGAPARAPRRGGGLRDVLTAPRRDRGRAGRGAPQARRGAAARRARVSARRARPRRRPHRAAVAAPARHRRDVPRVAAPGVLTARLTPRRRDVRGTHGGPRGGVARPTRRCSNGTTGVPSGPGGSRRSGAWRGMR